MMRSLHGFHIDFKGPAAVLEAIAARLCCFPDIPGAVPDLQFEYTLVDKPSEHPCLRPQGIGRSFYDPSSGEAPYWPDQDLCYLELDHRARALCLPSEGRCIVSLLGPEIHARWIASHPLLTLPLLEMLKRRSIFSVHAAAFALNGRCVLLPGTSGAGKSTLSVAMLRSGFDYMGDDITFLHRQTDEGIRMLAFPEPIGLTDGAAAFFPDLSERLAVPLDGGDPKHEVELSLLSCNSPCEPSICWDAKPAALIFPKVSPMHESVLEPISSDEALALLASNLLLTQRDTTQAHLNALATLAREVPATRLRTGRDLDRVGETCRALLARSRTTVA